MIPVLSDGVVTLRAHTPGDLGTGAAGEHSVRAQAVDPEMVRWTTVPTPYTERDAEFFLSMNAQGWLSGGNRAWAIADAGTDDFLGSIDLRPIADDAAEIGFGLGPWAAGRGVMTRAVALALGWAFDPAGLGVRTVQWQAHVGNWASRRIAWKAGFRGYATVRDLCVQRGRAIDGWIATVRGDEVGQPKGRWLSVPTLPVTARDGSVWVLRPWRTDDAEVERVRQACSDPQTQRWLTHLETPYTADAARAFVEGAAERAAEGEAYPWALAPADGGPAVASISLFGLTRTYGSPELGWWAHPSIRGRGLVAAAVRAICDFTFGDHPDGPGAHRLLVEAVVGNTASIRVALAAGFTEYGRGHAEDLMADGHYEDCCYFERLRPDVAATLGSGGSPGSGD
jgi:RimJ/RimL family protein N-acetyltransferase